MLKKFAIWFLALGFSSVNIGMADFTKNSSGPLPTSSSRFNAHCISHQLRNTDSEFPGSNEFDSQINKFLEKNGLKGASLAVAYKGHLVYAKGYGLADVENKIPMQPYHVLRIASVSKLLTATAIMKLVEEGKLSLDSKVFGPKGLLNEADYSGYKDKKYEKVTIRHLLSHTAGWNRRNGDPVFEPQEIAQSLKVPYPIDVKATIQFALKHSLSYQPGSRYSYSNLGYLILGEIISKLSNQSYEDFVINDILNPLGIYDMHIGASFIEDHFWNESKYYEPSWDPQIKSYDGSGRLVPRVYGGSNIKLLGAAGGWVAAPSELLKFVLAIDGDDDVPDLISHASFEAMTTPDKQTDRLLGWGGKDDDGNLWRTGSLAGTSALVLSKKDGLSWAIILNTSNSHQKYIPYSILRTMSQAIMKIQDWPKYDLFTFKQMDLAKPRPLNYLN